MASNSANTLKSLSQRINCFIAQITFYLLQEYISDLLFSYFYFIEGVVSVHLLEGISLHFVCWTAAWICLRQVFRKIYLFSCKQEANVPTLMSFISGGTIYWTTSSKLVPQTASANFHGPTAGFLLCSVKLRGGFVERCQPYWRLCSVTCLCFGPGRRWIHPHHVAASADEGNIPDNVECETIGRPPLI